MLATYIWASSLLWSLLVWAVLAAHISCVRSLHSPDWRDRYGHPLRVHPTTIVVLAWALMVTVYSTISLLTRRSRRHTGAVHVACLFVLFWWGAIPLGYMSSAQVGDSTQSLRVLETEGSMEWGSSGMPITHYGGTYLEATRSTIGTLYNLYGTVVAAVGLGWWCASNLFIDIFIILVKVERNPECRNSKGVQVARWTRIPLDELDAPRETEAEAETHKLSTRSSAASHASDGHGADLGDGGHPYATCRTAGKGDLV